ncbi:hypothetical protein ACA910_016192 [Epithemia clementina (nom. ined.)]
MRPTQAIAKLKESGCGGEKEIATNGSSDKSKSSATCSKSPPTQAQQAKKGLMGTPRLSWCCLFWCCSCLAVSVGAMSSCFMF